MLPPAAIVGTVSKEPIEDPVDMRRREPGTAVFDLDDARRTVGSHRYLNERTGRREAGRIVEQVLEYLRHAVCRCPNVAMYRAARGTKPYAGVALLDTGDESLEERGHVHR